jgi:hypothetical protein
MISKYVKLVMFSHIVKVKILPKETEAVRKGVLLEKLILDFLLRYFPAFSIRVFIAVFSRILH